jgi:hypothetical protein
MPRPRQLKWFLAAALLACAALIFARLGRNALWDDEADTALNAKSLLRMGDLSPFVDGHNYFACNSGIEIRNLKIRYIPPLPAVLTAASFALTRKFDAWSARLPARPPDEPYSAIARWIDEQLPAGTTVVVRPDWMTASLMFHAPQATYGWQLNPPPRGQFKDLPAIVFKGMEAPDVFIAAGPQALSGTIPLIRAAARRGIRYDDVKAIDLYTMRMSAGPN